MNQTTKTYTELSALQTFEERFEYLRLHGSVGADTFGYDRYLNQIFYKSPEWRSFRNHIIVRDQGCDLGIVGHEIPDKIFVHHLNPITKQDVLSRSPNLLDPNNAICVSKLTHDLIHYGGNSMESTSIVERSMNDQCPWRR